MKKYEKVRAPNFEQKIHKIISYINSYRSPNSDLCKSSIHSFHPKISFHTFSYFFIVLTVGHPVGGCGKALKHILDMALRSGDGAPDVLVVDHYPSSRATSSEIPRCASAPMLTLVQRSTRMRMLRWNESIAFCVALYAPTLTVKRMTGIFGYPTPCSPSTMRPRHWGAN